MQRQQHSRVDLGRLKGEIVKKLGAEKAKTYFFYLNRFLSSKITKVEFDKICFRVLGRENIVLHNQLISSILRNAYQAKVPPGVHGNGVCKPSDAAGEYDVRAPGDEIQQVRPCNGQSQTLNSSLLSNGSVLLPSPRKARSGNRERKFPAQAGGKAEILSSASKEAADGSYLSVFENGNANHTAVGELMQHHQILPNQLEDRGEVALRDSNKLPAVQGSRDDKSRASVRDSTYIETGVSTRSLLQAPLTVPLCAVGKSGARKALALSNSGGYVSPYDCGVLLDSETLKHGMEQIAAGQGLQGVSLDSANLLNNALDAYLKRLIRSSMELAGKGSGLSGSGSDLPSNTSYNNPLHGGFGNQFQPSNQPRIQSSYRPMDGILQDQRPNDTLSLLDFTAAMEMNPQQLGEDWSLLQEKMCINSFRD